MSNFRDTGLWRRTLGDNASAASEDAISMLKSNYLTLRERATALTAQIAKALPNLTIHDITHLDAIWETADLIAGTDYPLNPAEAFVFGGAILLHDAALCYEAYNGGQAGLRNTVEWKDAFAALCTKDDAISEHEKMHEADFFAMRLLHASRAADLALVSWNTPEDNSLYLLENYELRKNYGHLIGLIAASHNWPIEDLIVKLPNQMNALPGMPRDWRVDTIKIACLLRCADAAHIDSRRAPDFLRALASLHGLSAKHWTAQNWLQCVDHDTSDPAQNSVIFTSGRPFDEANADAWWVAFDAICIVDKELRSSADLLAGRPEATVASPPFQMRKVTGAGVPTIACKSITTTGWRPQAVEIHASNLARLINQLGGSALYGAAQHVVIVLRELIQNARDSIAARRLLDKNYIGRIKVVLAEQQEKHTLSVIDDGLGMSHRVITGPLLDFGSSFWASDLVKNEFPGLISSGYKPIGKFGIGFYSVFMIASAVLVASRRFDAGIESVTQVSFPRGLSLRPVVSSGAPEGFAFSASTIVKVTLQPEHFDLSSILVSPGRPGYESQLNIPLHQCLSIICAGLDATVELAAGTGQAFVVHRSPQELDTPEQRFEWLSQLNGGNVTESDNDVIKEHASRLRPIKDSNRVLGMAALSTAWRNDTRNIITVSTVGGLANSITKSDSPKFFGFIDYHPGSARREPSTAPSAGQAAIDAWASEQQQLLIISGANSFVMSIATCSLADLQCDPINIAAMIVRDGNDYLPLNLDQVLNLILTRGLAFYQSPMMPHVDTHHSQGAFGGMPTFWPVVNSAFLSLDRNENGEPNRNSVLSCIERRAQERGMVIEQQHLPNAVAGHFGVMSVLILRAKQAKSGKT